MDVHGTGTDNLCGRPRGERDLFLPCEHADHARGEECLGDFGDQGPLPPAWPSTTEQPVFEPSEASSWHSSPLWPLSWRELSMLASVHQSMSPLRCQCLRSEGNRQRGLSPLLSAVLAFVIIIST